MPPDGAVMVNAVDILRSVPSAPGQPRVVFGMEVPPAVNLVIGVEDSPFLDLAAEFKTEGPARHWEAEWPTIQHRLRANPYLVLSGFSQIVPRATVTREGRVLRLHLVLTRDETMRLLEMAVHYLGG